MDIAVAPERQGLLRRDWVSKYSIAPDPARKVEKSMRNEHQKRVVRSKIANFIQRAVYPQQLTIPRQYSTTSEGVRLYKVLEGREIDGIREQGVRVVVQENAKNARFVMSPLLPSRFDAVQWARRNMGLTGEI